MLLWVYTCQNAALLEITCRGSCLTIVMLNLYTSCIENRVIPDERQLIRIYTLFHSTCKCMILDGNCKFEYKLRREVVHTLSRKELKVSTAQYYLFTQVNRMSRSRRVLAIGGKQRILRLDMVCIETILFHLDSLWGIRTTYRSIVYRMMITLKTIHLFELNLFEVKSHLNSEMQ